MRHARLALLAPLALTLSGCCDWWGDSEPPYHDLRVNNRTDQTVTVRYDAVVDVTEHTDADGDLFYTYDVEGRTTRIEAGKHKSLRVPRDSEIQIQATYNNLVHQFVEDASAWCSCAVTISMDTEDFYPPLPPPMPVANG